jgi:hypothetical protein
MINYDREAFSEQYEDERETLKGLSDADDLDAVDESMWGSTPCDDAIDAQLDRMTGGNDEDGQMSDVEADADVFRSCGWGTDEDYGGGGGDEGW